jgi:hypothetical protein
MNYKNVNVPVSETITDVLNLHIIPMVREFKNREVVEDYTYPISSELYIIELLFKNITDNLFNEALENFFHTEFLAALVVHEYVICDWMHDHNLDRIKVDGFSPLQLARARDIFARCVEYCMKTNPHTKSTDDLPMQGSDCSSEDRYFLVTFEFQNEEIDAVLNTERYFTSICDVVQYSGDLINNQEQHANLIKWMQQRMGMGYEFRIFHISEITEEDFLNKERDIHYPF